MELLLHLTTEEKNKKLETISKWVIQDDQLLREFIFSDFEHAIKFVNQTAQLAQSENHHPDIFISYNKVKLSLTTHQAGGLTTKDFSLANKIDQLV
jgi:4a-hydroxytetrahydrobiopterin dehydratase